ncbi:MAG: hypothetical protein PHS46_07895 [Candidatus Omnitrophica bacterium]|nr:hypothetical protein [Candidatus Omnitrophota bacterium]
MTFDIQKSRQECGILERLEMLPAALEEIERLRIENTTYREMTSPGLVVCQRDTIDDQAKQIEDRNLIIGHMQAASEAQAKRIAELEADKAFWQKRSQTLREVCNAAEVQDNKSRAALKKLAQAKRARGKALVEALDSLKRIKCQFAPCPGPNEPFVDMATCHRCYAIQTIEKQLAQEHPEIFGEG